MGPNENKIVSLLMKKRRIIFFALITCLALLIRFSVLSFNNSDDYIIFLHPWYEQIKSLGGLAALKHQVGNYNITYQFLICIFTYFPGKDIYWYKTLSIFFDFILAISAGILAQKVKGYKSQIIFLIVYSVVLFLPTIIFNSSLWAQCDSIYVSFIIISINLLLSKKYKSSFLLLGIALAFKLQSMFVLPFYILFYVLKKEFKFWNFFLIGVGWYLCCIPGFLYGRSLLSPIKIYIDQSKFETRLNVGYPNLAGLFGIGQNNIAQPMLHNFLLIFTLAVLCVGLMIIIELKNKFKNNSSLLMCLLWVDWTCVMFLPNMHDRYGYLVDILLVILTIILANWRLAVIATISVMNTLLVYCDYLFGLSYHIIILSYISILVYVIFTILLFTTFASKSPVYKIKSRLKN